MNLKMEPVTRKELLWQHSWQKATRMLYPASFRLETRTQDHSGTVRRQCTHVYMYINTEQETTLRLSLRDACRLRHLRWFWRQRTSQFRRLCSNTTCKWGLSHQILLSTAKLHIFHLCILYVKTVTGLHWILVFIKKNMYNKIQIA